MGDKLNNLKLLISTLEGNQKLAFEYEYNQLEKELQHSFNMSIHAINILLQNAEESNFNSTTGITITDTRISKFNPDIVGINSYENIALEIYKRYISFDNITVKTHKYGTKIDKIFTIHNPIQRP